MKTKTKKKIKFKGNKLDFALVTKLCPLADSTSVLSLFSAMNQGYKYFLTSDKQLIENKKGIMKLCKIKIITSVYEMAPDERVRHYGKKRNGEKTNG